MPRDASVLANYFSETITGPNDQDISFLVVGNKGSGKSGSTLGLACMTAMEIAKRKRKGRWTDYFNFNNIAIIDPIRASELMSGMDEYGVYIFDDIGLGWNARNYMKQDNKDKNDIFQINRVDRCCQMFSVPNQFLLDKVPRSLISHLGILDKRNPKKFFQAGFAMMKFYEPETLFHINKQLYPFLAVHGGKYVSYMMPPAPKWMQEAYNKERRRITKEIKEQKRDAMKNGAISEENGNGKQGTFVSCHKCGHSWYYTGNKPYARCGHCDARVPVSGFAAVV